MQVHGLIVGVARPRPVDIDGVTTEFEPLVGVETDVATYRDLIAGLASPTTTVDVHELTDDDGDPSPIDVLSTIARHTEKTEQGGCDCDCFVVAFVGHGVQLATADEHEPDRRDEAFVTSHGLIVDNEMGRLWDVARPELHVAMFNDSCHSQSFGRRVEEADQPDEEALASLIGRNVERRISPGPSRVFFSAVAADAEARATGVEEQRPRGIFTTAVADAWKASRPRDYVDWHRAVARRTYTRHGQMPTLECDGVTDAAMWAAPFGQP